MALSNWDTLAVDEHGESCSGSFVSPLGVEVTIHKNWLYVRSEAMWQEGGAFVCPTIAEIQEGRLRIGDVQIVCRRGPQEGVFAFVWHHHWDKELKCSWVTLMAGCGVYGYHEDGSDEAAYVGVSPESLNHLEQLAKALVRDCEIPDDFALIKWDKLRRFNQGDRFFAGSFGIDTPESPVGEAEELLISDAVAGFSAQVENEQSLEPTDDDSDV